jgi:hypothetical protein
MHASRFLSMHIPAPAVAHHEPSHVDVNALIVTQASSVGLWQSRCGDRVVSHALRKNACEASFVGFRVVWERGLESSDKNEWLRHSGAS